MIGFESPVYGNKVIDTPNIDYLASIGTVFDIFLFKFYFFIFFIFLFLFFYFYFLFFDIFLTPMFHISL